MQLQAELTLALEIRGLMEQIAGCERDALGHARAIGDLLLSVPEKERPQLWEEAGLKRRNAFNYMRVARCWDRVQRAASIRQALAMVRKHEDLIPVDLRDVPLLGFDEPCLTRSVFGSCPAPHMPIGECAAGEAKVEPAQPVVRVE